MESKTIQPTSEYIKKKQAQEIENKLIVTTAGRGKIGLRERRVQTIRCKISHKNIIQGIQPI